MEATRKAAKGGRVMKKRTLVIGVLVAVATGSASRSPLGYEMGISEVRPLGNALTNITVVVLVLLAASCGHSDPGSPEEVALGPFASTLEGEVLARYEEMTPRQRQGVETLAERLGAERTTEWLLASLDERLRIFPLEPYSDRTAFGATLEGEPRALYERLDEGGRADIELYAAALGHEAAARSLLELREMELERMEQDVSRTADSGDAKSSVQPPEEGVTASLVHFYTPGGFRAPLPSLEDALSPDEKAKLDTLDPRIRKAFVQGWEYSAPMVITVPDPVLPGVWLAFIDPGGFVADGVEGIVEEEKRVLMAIPSEIPPIEDLVYPEVVAEYEGLHPDLKENFWREVGFAYGRGITVGKWAFGPLTEEQSREFFGNHVTSLSELQAMTPKYRR